MLALTGISAVSGQVYQQVARIPGADQDAALTALSGWAPKVLRYRFLRILGSFTDDERQRLLSILDSPAMRAAREAEAVALEQQNSDHYLAYQQRLNTQPPSETRLAMVAELDRSMKFSEWLLRVDTAIAGATHSAADSDRVKKEAMGFLLFAYRYTSPADMQTLISHWQTPVMQDWLAAATAALPVSSDSTETPDRSGHLDAPAPTE